MSIEKLADQKAIEELMELAKIAAAEGLTPAEYLKREATKLMEKK